MRKHILKKVPKTNKTVPFGNLARIFFAATAKAAIS
jgi:hypothetical protein